MLLGYWDGRCACFTKVWDIMHHWWSFVCSCCCVGRLAVSEQWHWCLHSTKGAFLCSSVLMLNLHCRLQYIIICFIPLCLVDCITEYFPCLLCLQFFSVSCHIFVLHVVRICVQLALAKKLGIVKNMFLVWLPH